MMMAAYEFRLTEFETKTALQFPFHSMMSAKMEIKTILFLDKPAV